MTTLKDTVMTTLHTLLFAAITGGCIFDSFTKYKALVAANFDIKLWPTLVLVNVVALSVAYVLLDLLFKREEYDTAFRTTITHILSLVKEFVCRIFYICGIASLVACIFHTFAA